MAVDYSLYLVTDSTLAILGDKDLASVVESALEGGVTIVQYRDKTSETADLIRMGKRLHAITKKYHVPLLINDRVDVAQAIGAEGVHLGQEDMSESPDVSFQHIHWRALVLSLQIYLLVQFRPRPHYWTSALLALLVASIFSI